MQQVIDCFVTILNDNEFGSPLRFKLKQVLKKLHVCWIVFDHQYACRTNL